MKLWADAYDSNWTRLGDGPVTTIRAVSVTRTLDGIGTINMEFPLSDERAFRLLDNERRFALNFEVDGSVREIGRGIVRSRRLVDGDARSMSLACVDDLDELKRISTLLARSYSGQSVSAIVAALTALASGWTATVTGGAGLTSMRFDGVSVFKALQEITSQQGLHLRRGTATRSIEIGAFGTSAGLQIVSPDAVTPDAVNSNDVAFLASIDVEEDSEDVVNYIVPLGQGEGESALTLRYSNRVSPYAIQTVVASGKTHYYIADAASIATFGTIQRCMTFKQIGAISNSDADLQNASNALYDAAASWMSRHAAQLNSYNVRVRKCRKTIRPGDKVRLTYTGIVNRNGVPHTYIDVDEEFWVMSVTERVGMDGSSLQLKLNSIDRQAMDVEQILVGALDEITIRNLRVQTYPSVRSFVYRREIASGFPAIIPIVLTESTTQLNRAIARVTSRPFRSTAAGGASGGGVTSAADGDHRHRMFDYSFDGTIGGGATRVYFAVDAGGSSEFVQFNSLTTDDLYTFDSSGTHTHTIPAHTHPQAFGISDDSATPVTISAFVDTVDRTTALGGSWAGSGGTVTFEIDITEYLVNAAGGLRSAHTLEFRCASGQGEIEVTVELYETIQSITV